MNLYLVEMRAHSDLLIVADTVNQIIEYVEHEYPEDQVTSTIAVSNVDAVVI